jgi:hypothetical protein
MARICAERVTRLITCRRPQVLSLCHAFYLLVRSIHDHNMQSSTTYYYHIGAVSCSCQESTRLQTAEDGNDAVCWRVRVNRRHLSIFRYSYLFSSISNWKSGAHHSIHDEHCDNGTSRDDMHLRRTSRSFPDAAHGD